MSNCQIEISISAKNASCGHVIITTSDGEILDSTFGNLSTSITRETIPAPILSQDKHCYKKFKAGPPVITYKMDIPQPAIDERTLNQGAVS